MKAVVDSSVLVSAFLTGQGAAGALLVAGLQGRFEVYVSDQILVETTRRLLGSEKLKARYGYTEAEIRRYVDRLSAAVTVLSGFPAIEPACRDPDDDHVLAAALAADADCVITGDRDLLELGTYQGVSMRTVRETLDALR